MKNSSVYKYCSAERAVEILSNERIFLNTHNNFNDLFDSDFIIDDSEKQNCINLVLYFLILQDLSKKSNKLNEKENKIYKLLNIFFEIYDKGILDTDFLKIKNKLLGLDLLKRYESFHKQASYLFDKEIKEKIENIINDDLIACFSKRNDSILMRSHYGDSCKGFCFEIEPPLNLKKVEYSSKRRKFDLGYIVLNLLRNPNEVKNELEEIAEKPFFIKADCWNLKKNIESFIISKILQILL